MDDWTPTWVDKQGYGRDIDPVEAATLIVELPEDEGGGADWRHIHFLATMHAENAGLREWARPMVWKPGNPAHLSIDRGICALNSFWWAHVHDRVAYDWKVAVPEVIRWLDKEAEIGTKGAKPWDWKPLLDWQWHAFGTERYEAQLPLMRQAINTVRSNQGLDWV